MKNLANYQKLTCENCGNSFVWSSEEQELYMRRNLEMPKYCPICRGIMEARSRDESRKKYEDTRTTKT